MNKLGFTYKLPERRAREQNQVQVNQWLNETYPKIKRKAKRNGAIIMWADETANKDCNALRIINVSCTRTCPTGISCEESEKEDFCGECKNTKANEYICIAPHDSIYGPPGLFGSYTQLFTCENGRLNSQMMCPANICDPQTGQCD